MPSNADANTDSGFLGTVRTEFFERILAIEGADLGDSSLHNGDYALAKVTDWRASSGIFAPEGAPALEFHTLMA